ncbi:MAG TPA: flavin reductase family protein, partial [Rhizomicrobium sp.]|nr:flavin reductase family protein [Rhizomicrobium sp.]
MDLDIKGLREALGCFPTGIAVMTAASQEMSHIGITVNSFTSVSLEPPLVLWCIDRRSRRYPHFAQAPGFTVSILASGHRE